MRRPALRPHTDRMDILLLLIPMSVVLVLVIGAGFWWAVSSGQFDDLEGPAHRILADDDSVPIDKAPANPSDLTSVKPGTDRGR